MTLTPESLSARIVAEARDLGFHRVAVVPVEPARRHELYRDWLAAGHGGDMEYLSRPQAVEMRRDPRTLLGEARTVVVVALSYAQPDAPAPEGLVPLRGFVARYARGEDYHAVFRRKLYALADRIGEATGHEVAARPCVDSAPVLERDLAEAAGVGFVAKNTMLIAPGLGSYVLLGELLLDADVAPVRGEDDRKRCGDCRACLDACPTGAFVDAFVLDARRCISYLTIELKGPIPRDLRPLVGTRVFGCDVCQEVCPFNARVQRGTAAHTAPAPELAATRRTLDLVELVSLTSSGYRRLVKGTSLARASRNQLMRNACVALGNAGDAAAIPALREALARAAPLVRRHAAWALGRLGDVDGLAGALATETDDDVREEITCALSRAP